jgi:UDPglucose 6-dehydrogenase
MQAIAIRTPRKKYNKIRSIMFKNIGIIGLGFVGGAIRDCYFSEFIISLDTDPTKGTTGTYEQLHTCSAIFVCVPSPMGVNGVCDSSILESTLENLKDYKGVIISKVTATPDIYQRLQLKYDNLVYVPEFLTAANAARDYARASFMIIGGSVEAYRNEAARILKIAKPELECYQCSITEASLIKYTINSFLAAKVVFMNEMQQLANASNCDWENIRKLLLLDSRIGNSHMQVPGPDGQYGFGGMCFPKDTSALIEYGRTVGVGLSVLNEATKKNTLLRLQKPK